MAAEDPVARPPGRGGRTPWGTMSRERVVAAAEVMLAERGLEGLTIRGLAAELGVAPMTLYGHVRDKDDLLDEVVDRLVGSSWEPPGTSDGDVGGWLAACADRLRELLVSQPAALHVYLRRPALSPAALARMEAMVGALRRWGASDADARAAYGAIQTYTVGFAALQASRAGWEPPSDDEADLAHQLARLTSPAQFFAGLGYLIEGVRRRTDAGA